MLKAYPGMVTSSCFIDPVTFCVWEGDVCNNFLYRSCLTVRPPLFPLFLLLC